MLYKSSSSGFRWFAIVDIFFRNFSLNIRSKPSAYLNHFEKCIFVCKCEKKFFLALMDVYTCRRENKRSVKSLYLCVREMQLLKKDFFFIICFLFQVLPLLLSEWEGQRKMCDLLLCWITTRFVHIFKDIKNLSNYKNVICENKLDKFITLDFTLMIPQSVRRIFMFLTNFWIYYYKTLKIKCDLRRSYWDLQIKTL